MFPRSLNFYLKSKTNRFWGKESIFGNILKRTKYMSLKFVCLNFLDVFLIGMFKKLLKAGKRSLFMLHIFKHTFYSFYSKSNRYKSQASVLKCTSNTHRING